MVEFIAVLNTTAELRRLRLCPTPSSGTPNSQRPVKCVRQIIPPDFISPALRVNQRPPVLGSEHIPVSVASTASDRDTSARIAIGGRIHAVKQGKANMITIC